MRYGILVLALALCAGCASNGASTNVEPMGMVTSAPTAKTVELSKIATMADGTFVEIEGKVSRVCQNRGCWVEVTDGTTTVMAKIFDHSIKFPKDCVGKTAYITGHVKAMKPADHCGKHKEEEEEGHAHKDECPKPSVMVSIKTGEIRQ